MAKNAEDRYQSAMGLKCDLSRCLSEWKKNAGDRHLYDRSAGRERSLPYPYQKSMAAS